MSDLFLSLLPFIALLGAALILSAGAKAVNSDPLVSYDFCPKCHSCIGRLGEPARTKEDAKDGWCDYCDEFYIGCSPDTNIIFR